MVRWILALCSALLLVCVTLQTAAACEPLAQEMGAAVAAHDDDGTAPPDLAPDLPELYFLPAGQALPQPLAALPPTVALPLSTSPYLGVLLRPPRARA